MTEKDEKTGPERSTTPVGQYYLLDKIAQGGMAEIYKGLAYDLHGIKKTVVIKKILPQISADPEFVNMLINEAKIAVMLSHGNIAQIYDLGKVGNDYFMVMEYVDGKSLSQIHRRNLKKGSTVPVDYVCYFVSEVANGINYMHRRTDDRGRNLGIIHRDISPQNVIVSYSGTVKIIDFGIAKAAIQIHITDSGVLKGKFAYMSPEQAKGEPADQRSDIFSLGVILHELLTGRRLFKGKNKKETLQNVRRASAPAPSTARAGLPPEIDRIVMKALARDPKNRYTWASELHDDLIKFLYTHYPDFQPSSVSSYIRELFKDEIAEREGAEEEAKTPFLIIDHTQSAILDEKMEITGVSKVPPQLREFMLDDETPAPKEEEEPVKKEKKPLNLRKFFRTHWRGLAAGISCLIIILFALFFTGVNQDVIDMPRFLSRFAPQTMLTINVEPFDAEVTFGDAKLKGKPPYKLKGIKPGTSYRLIIEKKGFSPYFMSVALGQSEKRKLNVVLTPEPPHYAELNITSEPAGATIFLNEKNANLKTPAKLTSLAPNTYHTLGLFLEDHIFWSRDIYLKPDEEKSLNADLAINYGELQIISTPEGADVSIDSKPAGKTPFKKEGLAPGTVMDITVSKEGFTTWSGKTKIKAGGTLTLRPNLSRTKELLVPHFLRDLDKPIPKEPQKPPADMLPPAPLR